jgi:hypothetical protein
MKKPYSKKRATDAICAPDRRFRRSVRTLNADGGYTVARPSGEQYRVSATGDIDGDIPGLLRVQVQDVTLIVRHDVISVFETASHTLHFVGGGVLSYWCWKHAIGITLQTKNIACCKTADGILIVSGTAAIDP